MKKRGQFFLIAALVIVGIVAGLATVYNITSTLSEEVAVYDLSSEMNFEGSQVLASGVFNDISDDNIVENLEYLIKFYAETNPENEFIGIYGNLETLTIILYKTETSGSISLIIGGPPIYIDPGEGVRHITQSYPRPDTNKISVKLGEDEYFFNIKPGQSLYVIVTKERAGERFVATPGEPNTPQEDTSPQEETPAQEYTCTTDDDCPNEEDCNEEGVCVEDSEEGENGGQ